MIPYELHHAIRRNDTWDRLFITLAFLDAARQANASVDEKKKGPSTRGTQLARRWARRIYGRIDIQNVGDVS